MDAIEAVAEAWASIDGRLDAFRRERAGEVEHNEPENTGHYEGYMVEAEELIKRVNARGFDVAPASPPKSRCAAVTDKQVHAAIKQFEAKRQQCWCPECIRAGMRAAVEAALQAAP